VLQQIVAQVNTAKHAYQDKMQTPVRPAGRMHVVLGISEHAVMEPKSWTLHVKCAQTQSCVLKTNIKSHAMELWMDSSEIRHLAIRVR